MRSIVRELRALRGPCAAVPHVVRLESVFVISSQLHIAYEASDGNLEGVIRGRFAPRGPSPALARAYLAPLLSALAGLHAVGYAHRDVKPANILVNSGANGGAVRLCDFGLARPWEAPRGDQALTPTAGTVWYRSPEQLCGAGGYDGRAADVWAAGCVFAELLRGEPLFPFPTDAGVLAAVATVRGPLPVEWRGLPDYIAFETATTPGNAARVLETHVGVRLPPTAVALLDALLATDPKLRPSAEAARQHPFFSDPSIPAVAPRDMPPVP